MSTRINLDEFDTDAFWSSNDWTLPDYKSAEFFKFLTVSGLSLVDFKKTPVYGFAKSRKLIVDDTWKGNKGINKFEVEYPAELDTSLPIDEPAVLFRRVALEEASALEMAFIVTELDITVDSVTDDEVSAAELTSYVISNQEVAIEDIKQSLAYSRTIGSNLTERAERIISTMKALGLWTKVVEERIYK